MDNIPGTIDDDFHISVCSPAIDAGDNAPPGGLPAADLDGDPRLVGSLVDLGAYENQVGFIDCNDSDVCTFDGCGISGCFYLANTYGDVDFNNTVNLFDLFCVLDGFGGVFSGNCTFDRLDIEPCGGNASPNLFDLFAILDSFSGIDPCCGGLP